MIWPSAAAFWAMGGYGVYVWGSFGAAAVALVAELVWLRQRRAAVLERLRMQLEDAEDAA